MVITHELELRALAGRLAHVIDPHGETLAHGLLTRLFDAGRIAWRVGGNCSGQPVHFELADVADIAGTVIELRGAR